MYDIKLILSKLKHDGAIYRMQGIAAVIQYRITEPEIVAELQTLKQDNVIMLGRPLRYMAIAALDIIGAEKYTGDDKEIIELIEGLPETFSNFF